MFCMIIRVLGRLKAEEANEADPRLAAIDALIPNMQSLENKVWQDGPIYQLILAPVDRR
jgi:hypothetical protein